MNLDLTRYKDIDLSLLSDQEVLELERLIEVKEDSPHAAPLKQLPFEEFCYKYLTKHFQAPFPEFRKATINYLNNPDIIRKKLIRVEPRSHGKSTTYLLGYTIYQICYGLRSFIVYFAATKTEARGWLNNIRMEFENNEQLVRDFPYLQKEISRETGQATAWNDNDLFFSSGQRVSCKGWFNVTRGLNHYGRRPDFILIDDAESEQSVNSALARQRFFDYYLQAVANLSGSDGADTFIVGTILHPESFLAKAVDPNGLSEFKDFNKNFHRAVINWETKEVLWPEMWSFDKLLQKQSEIGEVAFAQEFQGIPAKLQYQIFSEAKIHTFRQELKQFVISAAGWDRFMYVDPSMGKEHGDYCSLAIIYVNSDKDERLVYDWITRRYAPEELGNTIAKLHEQHHFREVGFETNATQGVFINLFKKMYADAGIRVPFVSITHSMPKKNRIDALEPAINNGRLKFRPDWQKFPYYALGMRQLFNYDGRQTRENDDGPDSLAGVNELVNMRLRGASVARWTNA